MIEMRTFRSEVDIRAETKAPIDTDGKSLPRDTERGFREGMWAVSPYNFDERVREGMHLPASVQLMDMTLREGRQVAGVSVGLDEVLEFVRRIDDVGVHIVEMHHDFIDEIKRTKAMGVNFRIQASCTRPLP